MAENTSSPGSRPYAATLPYGSSKSFGRQLPHVSVPPPDYNYSTTGNPTIRTSQGGSNQYQDDKYGSLDFLQQLAKTRPVDFNSKLLQWTFDMRREAQPILPFLYLGPSISVRDTSFLDNAGITLLLAVRSSTAVRARPKYLDPATYPAAANRQTATFDLDTPFDFITGIKPAVKTVVNHLQTTSSSPIHSIHDVQARVLVFCESGNDRSATFVAAFMMVIYGLGALEAMQLVQSQRFCSSIDDGMRRMLLDFGDILAAERQVVQSRLENEPLSPLNPHAAESISGKKRDYNDYEDEEMVGMEGLENGHDERLGVAPFADLGR